jgi:hypothetical protein
MHLVHVETRLHLVVAFAQFNGQFGVALYIKAVALFEACEQK